MVKKYDELSVIKAFSMVLTDASVECNNFLLRQWGLNRENVKKYGIGSALYRDSVDLVREAIRRCRVHRYVSDNAGGYFERSAFTDKVSIPY